MEDDPLIKKVYSRKYPITADIIISDTHIGHKMGIIWPYKLDDYKPNKYQMWLYNTFMDEFIPDVKHILKQAKPKFVHGLFDGDMGDIDFKNRSSHFWSKNPSTIAANANNLLEPLVELMDGFRAVKGTKSHTGEKSSIDEDIANNFDHAIPFDEYNTTWYSVEYKYEGVRVEARHKGKNKSKWADENLLSALRSEIILDRAQNNRPIPHISYRGHFHWFGSTPDYKEYRVVSIPSWQLPNGYVAEIDPVGRTAKVGGYVGLYQNGQVVDGIPLIYTSSL